MEELGILSGKLEFIHIFELPGHVSMIPFLGDSPVVCESTELEIYHRGLHLSN